MYTKGASENKKWILAVEAFLKKENEEEKPEEDEDEIERSPFDIYEKIRDIINQDLEDPDNDTEIKKVLSKVGKELKDFLRTEKDEEDEEEESKEQQTQQNPQQQVQMPQNQQMNQPGAPLGTDMGPAGMNPGTADLMGTTPTPPSGGQM